MMRLIGWAIVFLIINIGVTCYAGGIDVDFVYYYGDDSLTYCEVNVGLQRSELVYSQLGADSVYAKFALVASIFPNDSVLLSDTLDMEDRSTDSIMRRGGAYFPYVFRYLLRPGDYNLTIELLQEGGQTETWTDAKLDVPSITDSTGVSGLALGVELDFSAEPSRFTKNGIRFVPNPLGIYGSRLKMLYYYVECYGLSTESDGSDSLTVTRNVLFAESEKPAKQASVQKLAKPGSSVVIADGFPAYTLQSGTYVLELVISEQNHSDRIVSKKFYVYRPEDFLQGREIALGTDLTKVMLSTGEDILNTIDPDSALDLMQYVLIKQDIRRARDMDSDGKRRFMIEYWRTSHPDDPEAANLHFARVDEANHRYSFLNRAGWKTDRGRVLILFGEPDFVDRRYADAAGSDHEIWYYDQLEGGVLFVFVDQSGFGDLDLVHSTKRGEIFNPSALATQQNQNPVSRGLRE